MAGAGRPAEWAQPVGPDSPDLPNLFRVTPRLYRSAQPSAAGFRRAAELGIRTVLSLRQTVDDKPLVAGSGLAAIRVPMKSRAVGEDDSARIIAALRAIRGAHGPVLVHCHHGADRTGVICALWRMLYQGWTCTEAKREMVEGGYGFHEVWANIPRYLQEVDVQSLRRRVEG